MSDTDQFPAPPIDSPTPAERPARDRTRRAAQPSSRIRWEIVAPVVLVALVVLAAAADVAFAAGRVHAGVRVGGVDVGGLTREQAIARVVAASSKPVDVSVTVRFEDHSWPVAAEDIGAAVDATGSVETALTYGNSGDFLRRLAERVGAYFGAAKLPNVLAVDPDRMSNVLELIDETIGVPARDAAVSVKGTTLAIVPSAPGSRVDRDRLESDLLAAMGGEGGAVTARVEEVPAQVSDDDARQALADAGRLIEGPVTITWESKSWTVEPATIAKWLAFRAVPPGSTGDPSAVSTAPAAGADASSTAVPRMVLAAYFGASEVSATLAPLTAGVGRPAIDAQIIADEGKVTIKPGQTGLGPDFAGLAAHLRTSLLAGKRTAELQVTSIEPRLTTEAAQAMGIKERISKYTTTFVASAKDRVNNIHTLADALDGQLIAPGAVFDFNKTVGPRTAAKGYREAPAIVNGKLVPQLGGGICQIGTTFFNAVFFSGLPVVERRNHSFYISHYPKGRDCTITWPSPNFRFRNETSSWIMLRATYTAGSVTIALYGTSPGYTVEYTTSEWMDDKPHKVTEIPDPTLKAGLRVVEDGGVNGGKVVVVRTVYKGTTVVRTDTFTSKYNPKEETVRVGTKPAGSKPTTPTP